MDRALTFAEDFDKNIEDFVKYINGSEEYDKSHSEKDRIWNNMQERELWGEVLVDVLLNKIALEQVRLRNSFFNKGMNKKLVQENLMGYRVLAEKLHTLVNINRVQSEPDVYRNALRLLAGLETFERAEVGLWDWFTIIPSRNRVVSKVTKPIRQSLYKSLFGDPKNAVEHSKIKKVFEDYKEILKLYKQTAKTEKKSNGITYREQVRRIVMAAHQDKDLFSSSETYLTKEGTILSDKEYEQLLNREESARESRNSFKSKVQSNRSSTLISAESCRALMRGEAISRSLPNRAKKILGR